jgi:hypothetical protein
VNHLLLVCMNGMTRDPRVVGQACFRSEHTASDLPRRMSDALNAIQNMNRSFHFPDMRDVYAVKFYGSL